MPSLAPHTGTRVPGPEEQGGWRPRTAVLRATAPGRPEHFQSELPQDRLDTGVWDSGWDTSLAEGRSRSQR